MFTATITTTTCTTTANFTTILLLPILPIQLHYIKTIKNFNNINFIVKSTLLVFAGGLCFYEDGHLNRFDHHLLALDLKYDLL